ncbi:MAG TPA: hypothetical protein VGF15_01385 [Solirubrobacteraceae bacterium]
MSTSGCGSSASLDPVAQAAEATARLAGARIDFSERLSSAALGQTVTISGAGYLDQRNRSGELTMNFPKFPGVASSGTIQTIFSYPLIYIKLGVLAKKLPSGKPWIEINLQKAYQDAGINLSSLSSTGEADPTQFLSYLRGASGEVSDLGRETVDGAPSTRYKATIQFSRVADRAPANQRAGAVAAVHQLEKIGGASSMPVEVWIDAQHRVRRERLDIHEHVANTPLDLAETIDYVSFERVPAIKAPPAGQVDDLTSLTANSLKHGLAGGYAGQPS